MTLSGIKISVVIPTINKKTTLLGTLQALERQSMSADHFEVVVVDNTKAGRLIAELKDFIRNPSLDIRYLHEPQQGKSRAMKTGIAVARGEFIAGTDDDCLPREDWLEVMYNHFRNEKEAILAIVGNVLPLNPMRGSYGVTTPARRRKCTYGCWIDRARVGIIGNGSNVMYRRKAFSELGHFLPFLGPGTACGSGEEVEFFYRILKSKKKVVFIPQSVVFHDLERPEQAKKQVEQSTHLSLGAMYAYHLQQGDMSAGIFLIARLFFTIGISPMLYLRKLFFRTTAFHFRYRKDCIRCFVKGFQQYFCETRHKTESPV